MKNIRIDECKRSLKLKTNNNSRYYILTTFLKYTDLNTNKHFSKKYYKKYKNKMKAYKAFKNKKTAFLNKEVIRLYLEELF